MIKHPQVILSIGREQWVNVWVSVDMLVVIF